MRRDLLVFCHGSKEKWGSGRTVGWDGGKTREDACALAADQ